MEAAQTCGLLIGSGKCYLNDEGTIKKKGGIRRTRDKDGNCIPEGTWAEGDLYEIHNLLTKVKGVGDKDVVMYNYQEHDEGSGECAAGKIDVLGKIDEFFDQDDKRFFVLYYTGHGYKQDGSWVFPVQRSKKVSEQDSPPETDSNTPHESHSPVPEERDDPSGPPLGTDFSSSEESPARKVTVPVDVHEVIGSAGEEVDHDKPLAEGNGSLCSTPEPVSKCKGGSKTVEKANRGSFIESGSVLSRYAHLESDPVPRTEKLNDFVTFEDVIELWEEKKNGRDRYLMIILDCCYAGKWVEKITRRDVCIQAACRSTEICKVSKDQRTSVFTKAFASAQNMSLGQKVILSFLDHAFVLNFVSIARSDEFTPLSSQYAPFGNIKFFDSFDDMYLKSSF